MGQIFYCGTCRLFASLPALLTHSVYSPLSLSLSLMTIKLLQLPHSTGGFCCLVSTSNVVARVANYKTDFVAELYLINFYCTSSSLKYKNLCVCAWEREVERELCVLQLHLLFWGGRFGVGILRLQQNISIVNTQVEQSPAASHSSNRHNTLTNTHTHTVLKLLIPMSRATLHPPSAGAHFPTIHQSQSRLRLGICIVIVIIIVVDVVILAAIKAFLACLMFIL